MPSHLVPKRLWSAVILGVAGTLESPPINCQYDDPNFLFLRVVAAGASVASVKIQVAFSEDGVTFNSYAAQADVDSGTAASFPTTQEEYHKFTIPRGPWVKIRLSETAGFSTTVDGNLWAEEWI